MLVVMSTGKVGIQQVFSSDHFQLMVHLDGCTALTQHMLPKQTSHTTIKVLVHPKMKTSPCFTHPQGIQGVYDFLLSD